MDVQLVKETNGKEGHIIGGNIIQNNDSFEGKLYLDNDH